MIKSDKLKLNILKLLKDNEMTIGEIKKKTKTPHHYTITNSLSFLKEAGLIEINDKNDKLKSKIVKLKN